MTPGILKIGAGLVALHMALYVPIALSPGATPYQVGQLAGKAFWIVVVVLALWRVLKYGWGVSVFIICALLLQEARAFYGELQSLGPEVGRAPLWSLFAVTNVPLVAALIVLMFDASRAPFRARKQALARRP